MGICTGEGLTSDTSDERIDAKTAGLEGRGIREEKTGEDRRQKGGSPMGEKRAEEISEAFQRALDAFYSSPITLTGMRMRGREAANVCLEKIGLGRFVKPSSLLGQIPRFRKENSLQDIRVVVVEAFRRHHADVAADIGSEPIFVVDEGSSAMKEIDPKGIGVCVDAIWDDLTRDIGGNFVQIARLMHLDEKHKNKLSE